MKVTTGFQMAHAVLWMSVVILSSCSSSSSESESSLPIDEGEAGARIIDIDEGGSNNPFAFNKSDVQSSKEGAITGGKRSRYDVRSASAYTQANRDLPAALQKSYAQKNWSGSKDFSTGSYQTADYGGAKKKSWFGGRKSKEANQVARASGQSFQTNPYQTGSANEAGRSIKKKSNAYTEVRNSDGWGREPVILSEEQYREITFGQSKSLLGR